MPSAPSPPSLPFCVAPFTNLLPLLLLLLDSLRDLCFEAVQPNRRRRRRRSLMTCYVTPRLPNKLS